jgi:hypothetical protein
MRAPSNRDEVFNGGLFEGIFIVQKMAINAWFQMVKPAAILVNAGDGLKLPSRCQYFSIAF